MANPEHVAKLKEGVGAWNAWRMQSKEWTSLRTDLRHAELSKLVLRNVQLSVSDLTGAKLCGADLSGAKLSGADLRGADLREVHLDQADLRNASLIGADLSKADLSYADLSGAQMSGANFQQGKFHFSNLDRAMLHDEVSGVADLAGATFMGTIFTKVDLSRVKGLELCRHQGPSSIDQVTLERSGRLPLAFLRGCGLSDTYIQYIPSIFGQGIEFYSCFISYSTKDQEFADRLYADLQNKGVRCWFAPHDMQSGKKIHEQIDEAIKVYDRLLLILSEHSMASPWVSTEIGKARKRERALEMERLEAVKRGEAKERRRVLFPVGLVGYEAMREWECFDGDLGTDSAKEIREFFIPDFSGWKTDHDGYKREFERLVRDLKAT